MRKTFIALAVLLAGGVAMCRAADKNNKPLASPYGAVNPSAAESATVADVQDKPKDDGKDYVAPLDAKDAAPTAFAPPPAPCAKKSGIIWAAPERCHCGHAMEHWHHICDWLTYRPLQRPGLAGCCRKCGACHVPPLYFYFLDPYHACAPGNGGAGCAAPGCAGCAQP
jgi:hypothetical protein